MQYDEILHKPKVYVVYDIDTILDYVRKYNANEIMDIICHFEDGVRKSVYSPFQNSCSRLGRYSSRPTMSFLLHKDLNGDIVLHLWSFDEMSMGSVTITKDNLDWVKETLKEYDSMLRDDRRRCNVCSKWFPAKDMHMYSFAGIVCETCYDPKKHLPPDTRD